MKAARLFVVGIMFVVVSQALAQEEQEPPRKMVVGIGEIQYKAAGRPQSEAFGDMLLTALVRTRKFRIIERARMEEIMKEQGMSMFGVASEGYSGSGLNVRGVDYIITGAITEYGENVQKMGFGGFSLSKLIASMAVDIRLLKVADGEIILAESVRSVKEGDSSMSTSTFSTGQGSSDGALLGEVMRDCANQVSWMVAQNVN